MYRDILREDSEKDNSNNIIKIFVDYFKPKRNEDINSYILDKSNQVDEESFAYYRVIMKQPENCSFGEQKERILWEKIAIGVRDRKTQQKLLKVKTLTLENAVDICRFGKLSREFMKVLN